jgi:hypothetical protein
MAGRNEKKKNGGGVPPGRIEGHADFRRIFAARRKSKKLAESCFYCLHKNRKRQNQADNFTEDELQQIGLGYDRMLRFMERDNPNLRHPYDWYKYGEFGPYSWCGVVIGDPISDERVTLISEVRDQEEWEKIEHTCFLQTSARVKTPAIRFLGDPSRRRTRGLMAKTRTGPSTSYYIFAFALTFSLLAVTIFASIRVVDKLDRYYFRRYVRFCEMCLFFLWSFVYLIGCECFWVTWV